MRIILRAALALLIATLVGGCNWYLGSDTPNSVTTPTVISQFDPVAQTADIPFPNDLLFAGSQDGTVNASVSTSNPSDPMIAVDALDGFSTTASAYVDFSAPLAQGQDFAAHVEVFRLAAGGDSIAARLAPGSIDVSGQGQYSVAGDYAVRLEPDPSDQPGQRLLVQPLKPLTPQTHYLVVVEAGLVGASGATVAPSTEFQAVRSTTPVDQSTVPAIQGLSAQAKQTLTQIQQAYRPLFDDLGQNEGIARSQIVNAWTFTTQSVGASLESLRAQANAKTSPGTIALFDTGNTTSTYGGAGLAEVYIGTVTLPYYLGVPTTQDPLAPLQQPWQADPGQTPGSGVTATGVSCANLASVPASPTNCYPLPKQTAWVTVPVLATVPLASGVPESGDSVVIMQHGLTQNRTNLLAVADSLAQQHLVGIAIDHPLHGITPSFDNGAFASLEDDDNGSYLTRYKLTETVTATGVTPPSSGQGCVPLSGAVPYQCFGERTFNLDVNQDGTIDASGKWYVNLANPLVSRDNDRGSVVSLIDLYAILKHSSSLTLVTGTVASPVTSALAINNSDVRFMGHSLGAIAGTTFTAVEANASFPSVLANPGGGFARLLIGAPAFSFGIKSYLGSVGVNVGTRAFQQFLRLNQTVDDSADPVNYVAALDPNYSGPLPRSFHPVDMIEVIGNNAGNPPDLTVPNNVLEPPYLSQQTATMPGPLSGTDPLVSQMGLVHAVVTPPVAALHKVTGFTVTQFTEGEHSSLLEPDDSVTGASQPNSNFLPVTAEMQCEAAGFLASGGSYVPVGCS